VPPEAQPNAGRGAGGMGGGRGGRTGTDAGAATPGATAPAAAGKDAAAAPKDAAAMGAQSGRQRGQDTQGGQQANATMGTGGRGGSNPFGGRGGGGRGQGGGGRTMTPEQQKQIDAIRANTKLTPEQQRAEMAKIFGAMGGGRLGGQTQGTGVGIADRGAKTIDELLPPVVRRESPNQRVWIFVNNQLKPISGLRTGVSDGQFTEMVTGELKEGDKVVTNFILPKAAGTVATPQQQQGNPFQQQGGRGGGGGRGGF
jgi:hypothetical protein